MADDAASAFGDSYREGEGHANQSDSGQGDKQESSGISTLGLIGIVIAGLALLLGLLGYGSVSLINGVATAIGATESVDMRIIAETDRNPALDRESPDAVGEYTVDGQTHQIGLGGGEVGEVIEGHFPALPVDWLRFHDEPMTMSSSFWCIVIGLVCFGLLAVPIWLGRSGRKDMAAAAHAPPPGGSSMPRE